MQRWNASIAASVGVALLGRVTNFLLLAPDIVWRGTFEARRSHRESCRRETECVGMCSAGQLRSGFAKMQGWPVEKRAVSPSGMFRQRGQGERRWGTLHSFWDDASGKKRKGVRRLESWKRAGSGVSLGARGFWTQFFQKRAEYGNAETSVAPSGMIRRMERGIDAGRSFAPSGMIRQRE